MDGNKRYVTQINHRDMMEIAAAANAYSGDGIDVVRTENGLQISVDRDQLTRWVKTIIKGGNI